MSLTERITLQELGSPANAQPKLSDYDLDKIKPIKTSLIKAAVLIGFLKRRNDHSILLTRRTETLKKHSGQIALPGGKIDEADGSPVLAAIREATEEVGVTSDQISPRGQLPEYETITGFNITPIVADLKPPYKFTPAPDEVREIFEIPFTFVCDDTNFKKHSLIYQGEKRHYWAAPYKDYYIWGATAAILRELGRRFNN